MIRYFCTMAILFLFIFITRIINAQVEVVNPEKLPKPPPALTYQGEARDSKGGILKKETLLIDFVIYNPDVTTGSFWKLNDQRVTTDDYGLFTVILGDPDGEDETFNEIPWSLYPVYLDVYINYKGNVEKTTTQFLTVPYAFHARTATNVNELQHLTLEQDKLKLSISNDEVSLEDYVSHWTLWGDELLRFTGAVDIGDYYTSGPALRVDGNITVGKSGANAGTYGISGPSTKSGLGLSGGTFGAQIYLFGSEHSSYPNQVHLRTEGNERLVIKPNGNIGIGTTEPSEKLEVSGTVKATEFIGDVGWTNLTDVPEGFSDGIDNSEDEDANPDNEIQNLSEVLGVNNDGNGLQIKNIADPTESQDAATKAYVDLLLERIKMLEQKEGLLVIDDDGNEYRAVEIAGKYWMAENLKVTQDFDGLPLPMVESNEDWSNMPTSTSAFCWYNNEPELGETYGALYTYTAATKVCPDGWHLPSDEEWKELEYRLSGYYDEIDDYGWRFLTFVSGKLKEAGTEHWMPPNYGANNATGFTALPAGARNNAGLFVNLGARAWFWTSSQGKYSVEDAICRGLRHDTDQVSRAEFNRNHAFSVRCVKDD